MTSIWERQGMTVAIFWVGKWRHRIWSRYLLMVSHSVQRQSSYYKIYTYCWSCHLMQSFWPGVDLDLKACSRNPRNTVLLHSRVNFIHIFQRRERKQTWSLYFVLFFQFVTVFLKLLKVLLFDILELWMGRIKMRVYFRFSVLQTESAISHRSTHHGARSPTPKVNCPE